MPIFNRQTVGQNTAPNNKRKIRILIIVSVISIIFAVLLILSGNNSSPKTQNSPTELTTYSSNLYTFQYPKGWTKKGNALSLSITSSTDSQNDSFIKIERYSKVSSSLTPDIVEKLEAYDLKGTKIKEVESSRSQENNQNTVTIIRTATDIQVAKKYIFGAEYVWRITVSAPVESSLHTSINTIKDSFKIN